MLHHTPFEHPQSLTSLPAEAGNGPQDHISHESFSHASQDLFQGRAGLPNFALHSTGAQVVTELTTLAAMTPSWWTRFLGHSRLSAYPPETALAVGNRLGTCWNMGSRSGQLGISLTEPVIVSHVTVEHISRQLTHDIKLAPRLLVFWGLVDEKDTALGLENQLRRSPPANPSYP
ncbi:hypothetical protein CONPUDRAFT_149670 [Coniophora puteana RWD-64-598 SS2]|uniref:SUN domain-containing protein n=1 Tax=Coniophora puteana (strain RWD-64-598) TaxID=741705 RepID=A0A5M3N087_CONPW|nr:uncharacterized protein CONPUDRAFT_149670 [Coniophora puteana RWD-64-598 SS2]EIW84799.1 hypothetical protein CONPUDRAFT_149670 [Coniophora puteana RWD-64-598 SS2]